MRAALPWLAAVTLAVPVATDTLAQSKDAPQCLGHADRTARATRKYESFRAESAGARQQRTQGKFSPRYPIDVDSIVKIRGETRPVAAKGEWVEAELWCGFLKGKLVGTDLIVKNEKVRLFPEKKPTQVARSGTE